MNIHPALVHFPIALLSLYAVMELVRFGGFSKQEWWLRAKGLLVVLGTLSSYAATLSGGLAEEMIERGSGLHDLIEAHETAAGATMFFFTILAVVYVASFVPTKYQSIIIRIRDSWLVPILAVAGLVAVFVTGALGGALVYGPEADPFVKVVYSLLIK